LGEVFHPLGAIAIERSLRFRQSAGSCSLAGIRRKLWARRLTFLLATDGSDMDEISVFLEFLLFWWQNWKQTPYMGFCKMWWHSTIKRLEALRKALRVFEVPAPFFAPVQRSVWRNSLEKWYLKSPVPFS